MQNPSDIVELIKRALADKKYDDVTVEYREETHTTHIIFHHPISEMQLKEIAKMLRTKMSALTGIVVEWDGKTVDMAQYGKQRGTER